MQAVSKEAGSKGGVSRERALETLRDYTRDLPPLAAIQARVAAYDGHRLRLTAPLAANVNDKGSAFGGSMTSLMTYAGWGLVTLQLQQAGVRADVFVADSKVRYLTPLYADLRAEAMLAPEQSWDLFLATLAQRGRARIHLQARIVLAEDETMTNKIMADKVMLGKAMPDRVMPDKVMADLAGRYVAIAKG